MPSSHGQRVKTRKLMKKEKNRGIVRRILENLSLSPGDKVVIKIDPSIHRGMPHRRYHGKIGEILRKRGQAYEVKTNKGEKEVILIVRPEHLVRVETR